MRGSGTPFGAEGGGAVGALLCAWDRNSPLGAPDGWPLALRTTVHLLLQSRFPMFVAWGPDLALLYNDAYAELLGDKHPGALGAPLRSVWPDSWSEIAPPIAAAMSGAAGCDELPQLVNRCGHPDSAYTFAYSLIRDERGEVAGLFCAVAETTQQVRAQYRQAFQLKLEERLRELSDPRMLMAAAAEVLGRELRVPRVGYGEMDATGVIMLVEADWTDGSLPSLVGTLNLDVLDSQLASDFTAGRTLAVTDVRSDPRMGCAAAAFEAIQVRSTLAVPLIKEGRFVATLYLHAPTTRVWREEEIDLTREVAERTWAVVERARAEAILRERDEMLRLAIDAAEVGLWHVDMMSRSLMWPPRVKAMFGISADARVTVEDYKAALHPDDHDHVNAAFALSTDPVRRAPFNVEYRAIGKEDGKLRWLAARGRALFHEQGHCVRVVGTIIDITQRKSAEARMRHLNETLERRFAETLAERKALADIVEGTDTLVQAIDVEFNWIAVNRAAAREFVSLFSLRSPKAGDNMLAMLASRPPDLAAATALWSRALAGEEVCDTVLLGDPGHGQRYFEMRCQPLRDEAGRIVGAYQIAHDVTARLQEQARLRDAEAALVQVQKMEAVGQLTGGIAHDFNNLLSAIVGNFELIKARPDDIAWVKRFAQSGLQVAERGAKLTGQLLAFSRSQRIELKALDVAKVIGDMREMLARTLGPMIRLQFDLEARRLTVLSDATQLEMAVLNLAINARDAMAGGGLLTICCRMVEVGDDGAIAAGSYVEISVTDTGVGMSAEVLAHAFDPFFTTKGVGEGTGLGLSQVYAIARQAGGTASIESQPGQGTRVKLMFPCTDIAAVEDHSAIGSILAPGDGVRARVLVVDDDPDIRAVLKALLDALGYETFEAEDGATGLTLLQQHNPDLMMLDFAMPGMNGAEVARAARGLYPQLPIVFASGYADTAAIEDVPGPRSPLLRKPFAVDELQRALAEALARA